MVRSGNLQYFLVSASLQYMKGEATILKVFSDLVESKHWIDKTLKDFGELLDEANDNATIKALANGHQVHLYCGRAELVAGISKFFPVETTSLDGIISEDFSFWLGEKENALAMKWKEEVVASILIR